MTFNWDFLLSILIFSGGLLLTLATLFSALQTFVVPRAINTWLTRFVFRRTASCFRLYIQVRKIETHVQRDQIMALFAPVSLMLLVTTWFILVWLGYAGIYWALGVQPTQNALILSGSSLLTLGFATPPNTLFHYMIVFSEATIGLGLMAVLIAYLPTMYSAFSSREREVSLLEVRAGNPPSAVTMIERMFRLRNLQVMGEMWEHWEIWFADIEESHTSLGPLIFFRSPKSHRSWVTAAGAILDAAALYDAILDLPRDPRSNLCLRAGYLALRSVADFFHVPYDPNPAPDAPISITRHEFDEAYTYLEAQGIPLKPDQEEAWRNFAGWRVNYDVPLVALARLTQAPIAPWSSDRSLVISSPHRKKSKHLLARLSQYLTK